MKPAAFVITTRCATSAFPGCRAATLDNSGRQRKRPEDDMRAAPYGVQRRGAYLSERPRNAGAVRGTFGSTVGTGMRFMADIQGWLYGNAIANLKAVASGIDPVQLFAAMAVAALFGLV